MNVERGIPAQSEEKNLEKEYSYTVNEMTGEHIPFGEEPKQAPAQQPPPTSTPPPAEQGSGEGRRAAKKSSE